MADLIDRKAARQIVAAYSTAEGVEKALNAIAALPAQGVRELALRKFADGEAHGTGTGDDCTKSVALLSDPVAVHLNMLRGTIAKPTVEQIIHLYGVDALCKALVPVIVREAGHDPAPVDAPAEDATAKGETPGEMLDRLGMDGVKWAAEFRTTALRLGYSDMDEGWLIGWFCNAIMAGYDRAPAPVDALVKAAEAFKEFDSLPTAVKRPDLFELKVRQPLLAALTTENQTNG
jgi:hypothetical protein